VCVCVCVCVWGCLLIPTNNFLINCWWIFKITVSTSSYWRLHNLNTFQFPISYFQYHRTLALPNVGLWYFVWWITHDMWLLLIMQFWCNVMRLQLCASFCFMTSTAAKCVKCNEDWSQTYLLIFQPHRIYSMLKIRNVLMVWNFEVMPDRVYTGRHYELICKYR
jgi:hypothetical protein